MIQNFISIILFLKILFQAYNFRSTRSSGHQQRFFLFQIFYQKVSKPTKTSEKDHSFFNTASLKKPHVFYEPQLTWHWKEYAPKIQPKTSLTLQIFRQTCSCIVSKKSNIYTAQFLKDFESKYLYISVYLPKKVFIPKMQ